MEPNEPAEEPRNGTGSPRKTAALEERIRHLESALADFREADGLEEAVVDRVITKLLTAHQVGPLRLSSAEGVLIDGREMVHEPIPPTVISTEPTIASTPPTAVRPPQGAILRPPESLENSIRRGWMLLQIWSEVRLVPQMYFDPRYRLSRTAQFAVPLALGLFVASYLLFPILLPIPVVSPILERLLCVVVGILLYKVMTRELSRYREVLDYLDKYGFR